MTESTQSGLYKALESSQLRQARLGVTTVVALLSTAGGMGITWGAYANRLKEVEERAATASTIVQQQQITLAIIQGQNGEILRRLERIETKQQR